MTSKIVNKIKIDTYEINQPFHHQSEYDSTTFSGNYKLRLDLWPPRSHNLHFIEYIFVVFEHEIVTDSTYALVQANGRDLWERMDCIFYTKVLPLECENLYDAETNNLLQHMVRNKNNANLRKVLFIPSRTAKNGWLLDISPEEPDTNHIPSRHIDHVSLCLYGFPSGTFDIFCKLSDKNSQNIEKLDYSCV